MKITLPLNINDQIIPVNADLAGIDVEVKDLGLSMIQSPPPSQFGHSLRTITIQSTEIGDLTILLRANEPETLLFPGELPDGRVPDSFENEE